MLGEFDVVVGDGAAGLIPQDGGAVDEGFGFHQVALQQQGVVGGEDQVAFRQAGG